MRHRALTAMVLIPFLAACASAGGGEAQSTGASVTKSQTSPRSVRPPSRYKPRNPQVQSLPGIEGVIGSTTAELTRQFGPAQLEIWEGDARKLQFSGEACVLDIYLYPSEQGREPQASYVDARRPTDGQDVDRAACITALRQSPKR